ncbi:PREDICTED: uncharacterized protein LOC105563514 [Vollenhovia emeryi]|uniref:uncharacterized protein LOC105563514 n=1 Tax=Vollenhovia emeryi TaxID=411798 RepID=UPI0005F4EE76|nr:PREDICTED: uncharacterized protein LOC105563514 [Vollenhovia emeryi]
MCIMELEDVAVVHTCGICKLIIGEKSIPTYSCIEEYTRLFIDDNFYFYPVTERRLGEDGAHLPVYQGHRENTVNRTAKQEDTPNNLTVLRRSRREKNKQSFIRCFNFGILIY